MNLATLLTVVLEARAEDLVVICGRDVLTGQQLQDRAGRAAQALLDSGASVLAFADVSSTALPVALLAAAWAGVPFMPLNYRLSPDQLLEIIQRHPDALVLAGGPTAAILAEQGIVSHDPAAWSARDDGPTAPPWDDDPDAVAVLLHTSGTTSAPKAAVLRHRHLTSYLMGTSELLGAMGETALVSVPPYHVAGTANLLSNLYSGRTIVYLPTFSAPAWLEAAEAYSVDRAMVVPTMLTRLVEELEARGTTAPASLKSLSYGGARTPRPVLERALERFPGVGFVNAYGLTETASTIAVLGPDDHDAARAGDPAAVARLDSVGRVVPGVEVRIVDDAGAALPSGQVGEIWARGPQVSGEYLGGGPGVDADGWFHTRDLGRVDEAGYLYVHGRGDDTIIRGGENIAPEEIESVLHRHPLVTDVAVVGVPDEVWGERIAAVVVPAGPLDAEAVRAFARESLRGSKTPDDVVFRTELPYSPTGKLLRKVLRQELAGRTTA